MEGNGSMFLSPIEVFLSLPLSSLLSLKAMKKMSSNGDKNNHTKLFTSMFFVGDFSMKKRI